MPWVICILGLALAIAGGASVVHGYNYIQADWGWQAIIAGATAVSGGIVTIALGAVLTSLVSIRRAFDRSRAAPAVGTAVEPSLPVAMVETPPPPLAADVERPLESPTLPPAASLIEAPAKSERFRDRSAARALSASRSGRTSSASVPAEAPAPTVAGRYESGGASYVLFSDGTIDVESEAGHRHFASMDELKSFMARESPDTIQAEVAG